VTLRWGTESDVSELIGIWQAIWRHSFADILDADVEDPRFVYGVEHAEWLPLVRQTIVAVMDSHVVGFCYREGAQITDLWVGPPAQQQGIGRRLLSAALDNIAADGYRTATLDCIEANVHARRFYEREGGRPACRISRWSQSLTRDVPRILFEFDLWRRARP
jgi:ribosomal protein S18 acetylase RimI-like enzyme